MRNLDQIRATHAIKEAAFTDKSSVAKIPAMILTNGLLATIAFASESGKGTRDPMKAATTSLAKHLASPLMGFPELHGVTTATELAARLSEGNSLTFQRATAEALEYFSYLKRFAEPKRAIPGKQTAQSL